MKVSLFSLIKFGQKPHIQDLLDNGAIYMNHISEFIKIEDGFLRGDGHEALVLIEETSDIDILLDGQIIAKADSGHIAFHSKFPVGNIYSMYALLAIEDLSQLKIDARCKEFGDSCLIILDVVEFIDRVKKAVLAINRKLLFSPVSYEDVKSYRGKWTLFKKPITYNYQSEFRFLIKQEDFIGPVVLTIGSLKDIAVVLESECIDRLKVEGNHEP